MFYQPWYFIDSSRSKGIDVGFDGYPYYAFCTHLGSAVFDEGMALIIAHLLNEGEVDRCITHPAGIVVSDETAGRDPIRRHQRKARAETRRNHQRAAGQNRAKINRNKERESG